VTGTLPHGLAPFIAMSAALVTPLRWTGRRISLRMTGQPVATTRIGRADVRQMQYQSAQSESKESQSGRVMGTSDRQVTRHQDEADQSDLVQTISTNGHPDYAW
jgi:hypothetical protein